MLVLLLLVVMFFFSYSPMSFSILVVVLSVFLSVEVFSSSLMVVFPSLVIFIFSSGMMVIFCYCAIMVSYEEKQKKTYSKILGAMILSMVYFFSFIFGSESPKSSSMSISGLVPFSSSFMIFIMIFIFVLLLGVNELLCKPIKGLMESY